MLRSDRCFSLPALGVQLRTVALLHPMLRVHVVDNWGVVCEDALGLPSFPRVGQATRPIITVVLSGRARVTLLGGATQWLEEGSIAYFPKKNELVMRQEGARYRSIVVEYDEGLFGSRPPHPNFANLAPAKLKSLRLLGDELCSATNAAGFSSLVQRLFASLVAEGIALSQVESRALDLELDQDTIDLSAMLDRSLSRLVDRPARVDFEDSMPVTTRLLTDQIATFHKRFGFNADGWRDALLRRRVLVGTAAMTAKGATTETVSAALGYSSPTVFCRALAKASLPSPANVASAVKNLR